jgi:hypothetical protein
MKPKRQILGEKKDAMDAAKKRGGPVALSDPNNRWYISPETVEQLAEKCHGHRGIAAELCLDVVAFEELIKKPEYSNAVQKAIVGATIICS